MKEYTIGFIGAGRITRIMLEGFKKAGVLPRNIVVVDTNQEVLNTLKKRFSEIDAVLNDYHKPSMQDMVFLALHPPVISTALSEIKPVMSEKTIIVSFAPKVTINKIAEQLGGFKRIVRFLPNAPSIVNAGFNPIVFAPEFPSAEKNDLLLLLGKLGECFEVQEEKIEAYAIIVAMGPTYLWFQLEELKKLGESFGLTSGELEKGLKQMVIGTAKTMFESGLSSTEVIDLIPVKPLAEDENTIKNCYKQKLEVLYNKLKT